MMVVFCHSGDLLGGFEGFEFGYRFTSPDGIEGRGDGFNLFEDGFDVDFKRGCRIVKTEEANNLIFWTMEGSAE
eukprot:scaffold97811_cov17-Cyclotella_meneghiniana.AAC.1